MAKMTQKELDAKVEELKSGLEKTKQTLSGAEFKRDTLEKMLNEDIGKLLSDKLQSQKDLDRFEDWRSLPKSISEYESECQIFERQIKDCETARFEESAMNTLRDNYESAKLTLTGLKKRLSVHEEENV